VSSSKSFKKVIPIMLIAIMLLGNNAQLVNASTLIELGNKYSATTDPYGEARIITHVSGKIITANQHYASAGAQCILKIYITSETVILFSPEIALGTGGYTNGVTVLAITNYSATEALVWYFLNTSVGGGTQYFGLIKINVNAGTYTDYSHSIVLNSYPQMGFTKVDGANAYFVSTNMCYSAGVWHLGVWVFKYTGTAVSDTYSNVFGYSYVGNTVYSKFIQNPLVDNEAIGYAQLTGTNQIYYLKVNFVSLSAEVVALHSSSGQYADSYTKTLGMGVYEDTVLSQVYFWMCWVYPTTSSSKYRYDVFLEKMKFNNTISAGSLVSQSCITNYVVDVYTHSGIAQGAYWGYALSNSTEIDITLYIDVYAPGASYLGILNFYDVDLTDMVGSAFSDWESYPAEWDTNSVVPTVTDTDFIYRLPTGNAQLNELDAMYNHIITNVGSFAYNVEINLSYSPTDNPLYTQKTYTFTATITSDGNPLSCNVWMHQGSDAGAVKATGTDGIITFDVTQINLGIQTYTVTVILNSVYIGTKDFSYTYVAQTTTPTTTDITTRATEMITGLLLPMIVIGTPTIMFCYMSNWNLGGAMFGAVIGVIMGVVANIIPVYAIFLMVIAMVVYVVIPKGV